MLVDTYLSFTTVQLSLPLDLWKNRFSPLPAFSELLFLIFRMSKRIGIIGYGALGRYLAVKIANENIGSLQFVCNRSRCTETSKISCPITCLDKFSPNDLQALILQKSVEMVIEVAHPSITESYGESILQICDYMVGSPTAFANEDLLQKLLRVAKNNGHHLFVPVGAFWGAEDILRMADRETLRGLCVSMAKHPSCFRLENEDLIALNNEALKKGEATVLFEGSVAKLCKMAPNNVNTMAVAALAAHNIGFSKCIGKLISDPNLKDFHKIEIDVTGPQNVESGGTFTVKTVRLNPATMGGVTGQQTYVSFLSSLQNAISFPGPCGLRIC